MRLLLFFLFLIIQPLLSYDEPPVQINTKIPVDLDCDRLFKNLQSQNDSIALNSFYYLTNCSPDEVIPRINRYNLRDMFHVLNGSLPLFKDKFMLQLVTFTGFCLKNRIQYIPDDTLKDLYYTLMSDISLKERYKIENTLFKNLTLENIATLEYWSALYDVAAPPLGNSAGRILDIFYSENWVKIINDPVQLRIYLKKSFLYNRFGIVGSCNNYLVKFHHSPDEVYTKLSEMLKTEKDKDIKEQIIRITNKVYDKYGESTSFIKNIKLTEFLREIKFYDNNLLSSVIMDSSGRDYRRIIENIISSYDKDNIQTLINLLKINNSPRMTPYLLPLLKNNTILKTSEIGWHDL